ncbi:protein kinase [Nonomuraea sp. NPDC049709]|uniref:protein kinase domain-containing protein n=1 Tax=Nonomuraea sp. NPDC049709 TaxID=3154736 RepID=UPI00342196C8
MIDQTRRIGPYTLVRKLGEGGMGIVYLAQDAAFAPVALKVLRPELAGREDFRRRFTREAEAARHVARFCTAPVLDAGIEGDTAYLVTEYVEGPDLSSMIETQGPMGGANLEALAVGVATALAAIHEAGVVHLDLKPSNILLSAVGPRVIDFGIARIAQPDATQSAVVAGTPAYMAPEQANGAPITAASDVFAWGGVVTYAGTGRPPFGTGQVPEVLYRVAHHVPMLDGLDERLRVLVEPALQKDPARRPTAQQLLDRLMGRERATVASATRAVSDAWTPLLTPQAPPVPGPRPAGGGRWAAPVIAAVLASALTAGATLALWRPWEQPGKQSATVMLTQYETVTATPPTAKAPTANQPTANQPTANQATTNQATTNAPDPAATVTPGTKQASRSFQYNDGHRTVPIVLRIEALRWQGDDVKLEFSVSNDHSQNSLSVWGLTETNAYSLKDVELALRDEALPVKPMFQGDQCACSELTPGDQIQAGQTRRFFAVFRKVPKAAGPVDLDLKNLGHYANLLITTK